MGSWSPSGLWGWEKSAVCCPKRTARGGPALRFFSISKVFARNEGSPAFSDIRRTLLEWPRWLTLGWYDFRTQNSRTILGPFWNTVSTALWVLGLVLVFRPHMLAADSAYPVYVAGGIVVWNLLSSALSGGSKVFVSRAGVIRNINAPMMSHILHYVMLLNCRAIFQLPVVAVAFMLQNEPNFAVAWMAVPGYALVVLAVIPLTLITAITGARFRDLSNLISSTMRFLFFMSPVFWQPNGSNWRTSLAVVNPLTYFLEVVRSPLLGVYPSGLSWLVVLSVAAVAWLVGIGALNRYRNDIVFWL